MGVTLSTINSTLINISTLSAEEQALSITVTNITTETEEETSDETTEDDTSTSSGTTSTTSSNTGSSTTSNDNSSTSSTSSSSGSTTSSSSSTTYYYYSLVSGVNTELCNLINSERSSLGIYTLSTSSSLTSAAEDWAYTMAVNGAISHNYYGGTTASEIVLSTASSSASGAWSAIKGSSSHYTIATLSDSDIFTSIGAACVYDGVGIYYWCVYVGY